MRIPRIEDLELAYETGVHLGDGCLQCFAPHSYRYVLSGNRQNEQVYYRQILVPLLRKLYDVNPKIVESHGSIFAYVYSKQLVLFKNKVLGFPVGRKDQLRRLPSSILDRGGMWVARFISGLYDTDGCVKLRKTPGKTYPRISMAQKVQGIVSDVKLLLKNEFSITSTMYKNAYLDYRVGKVEVRWFLDINGSENFDRFMQAIGTRNPHVLSRIDSMGLGRL